MWSQRAFEQSLSLYNAIIQEIDTNNDARFVKFLKDSIDCLRNSYRLYGPQHLVGSFNGGKDAVCIMHLQRAVLASCYESLKHESCSLKLLKCWQIDSMAKPRFVFFDIGLEEFDEVRSLVLCCENSYELDLLKLETDFVRGVKSILVGEHRWEGGQHLSFVMGTRNGDPNCGKGEFFAPASDWAPPFMRINPIIEWDYGAVWKFLRHFDLKYCTLYDQGYTSLGKKSNTAKNCLLLNRVDGAYLPAYMLPEDAWNSERGGRPCEQKKSD